MYIQNVVQNSFCGVRSKSVYQKKRKPAQTVNKDLKQEFYSDIDKYLNKTYNKRKYFISLENCLKGLTNFDSFSEAEKQYLDELIVAIDDAGSIDRLSDDDLRTIMENFRAIKDA